MPARLGLWGRSRSRPAEVAPITERPTQAGVVVGSIEPSGAYVWRGIPYAASTAGPNRWRAPQPAPCWEGRRAAVEFASRCAQLTNQGDVDEGVRPGLVIGSEDCLAVDIYAPPHTGDVALPVMVWIHGGGNVWGRSGLYDASTLAVRENVVVVVPQYRLGPLGWFSHPALRSDATDPQDAAACFALLDLIASLKWVRDNVASFGGDPQCVTIFGESSGGHNVAALLASPLAAGLFHRAIIESGSFDSVSTVQAEGAAGDVCNPSSQIARRLGATTAAELRAASVEQLYAACDMGGGWFLDVPRVIQDGVVLPSTPLREAFASTETFHPVPVITGTNRDEMKLFYASDPQMTTKKLRFLIVARDQDFYDAKARYVSRVWRIRAVDEPAAMMAAAGHTEVYAYRFDWDDGGRLLAMDFQQVFGAAHGFEVPFVFGRFQHLGDADRFLFRKRTGQDRERLSQAMGRYWTSFARDGIPSCPGQPGWPRYCEEDGSFLRLDTDNDGGIAAVTGADTIDTLVHDLRDDPALSPADRRLIIEEMSKWMFTRPVHARLHAALSGAS